MNLPPLDPRPESVPPAPLRPAFEVFDPIRPIDLLPLDARPFRARPGRAAPAGRDPFDVRALQPLPRLVCLADVSARNVSWLWPGRVPIGKVTLIVGDPGVGKSLIALDVAARVTRGAPWPDERVESQETRVEGQSPNSGSPPSTLDPRLSASVLLLSAEDDLADTIRPRLEALEADCTRIIALVAAQTPTPPLLTPNSRLPAPSAFDLSRDVALLDRLLDARPDCRLVIVDPISAYLGRAVENVNAEVRRIIAPLAQLAARRRLAVVAISHLRKQQGAAIHRAMGSLAFVAAARAAWLVVKDPGSKDSGKRARRLLLPIKNNFAGDATGLAFTIEPRSPGALPGGSPAASPIICWSAEPINMAADDALAPAKRATGRPSDERDEAARWLETQLAAGARPSADLEELAVANGFKLPTLRRAFRDLGGEAVRIGFGPLGEWFWRLPGIGEQNPQPTSDHLWPDWLKNYMRPEC